MAMDILAMERRLKATLADVISRVVPNAPENASRLGEVLADGLTRYLIYARRPNNRQEEDFSLMIESFEFWAGMHGYPKRSQTIQFGVELPVRKPVQKLIRPASRVMTAGAGK